MAKNEENYDKENVYNVLIRQENVYKTPLLTMFMFFFSFEFFLLTYKYLYTNYYFLYQRQCRFSNI